MSTTQLTIPSPPEGQDLASVPMKFEVTPIPVTDFDRAKAFYQRLGWRLDIDLPFTERIRGVQFTPPGSPASIQFEPAGADRLQRLLLAVHDIEAARAELVDRGIDVSEIFHAAPGQPPEPGRDPGAARTSAKPPSRTPTATSGFSRRSLSGSRAGSSDGRYGSRAREQAGGGLRGRRAVDGGGQARDRLGRLTAHTR